MWVRWAQEHVYTMLISSIATEAHSNVVIGVNSITYIFVSMTLNTTHMRRKGGYNRGITLNFSRGVRVRFLHMCAKCRCSTTYSCPENSDWGVFRFGPP